MSAQLKQCHCTPRLSIFTARHGSRFFLRLCEHCGHSVRNSPLRLARSVMRISIRMSRAVFTAAPA
jgi:hypothetical protein